MREQVITWLGDNISSHRLQPILGVGRVCFGLVNHNKVSSRKAAVAGLMHNLAEFFSTLELLAVARNERLGVGCVYVSDFYLLHVEVSAVAAGEQFG